MSLFSLGMLVGRFQKAANNGEQEARATQYGSLAVAQVEPELAELARAGVRFGGGLQIIANAIASVQAIPTTTATLCLYNAEDAGGKSYLVDTLSLFLASGTADKGASLMVAVSPSKIASAPSAATGYGSASLAGSTRSTRAIWGTAVTLPGTPAWLTALANTQDAATTAGSGGPAARTGGGIIIPPGYGLGIAVLSGAGTAAKYGVSAQWSELALDLE